MNALQTASESDVECSDRLRSSHRVSVVVNTMGRPHTLRDCLSSLRRLSGIIFEVVVVVGPNSSSTQTMIETDFPDVRVIHCPLANLAISRNLGWRAAGADFVAFIDDDAVAFPTWLESLSEAFLDERVGAAGGFVRDHTGAKFQWQILTIDPLCNPAQLTAAEYAGPLVTNAPIFKEEPRFKYLAGTNMMYRRAALELVGGFDEVLAYGADDAELCLRLYARGWHLAHVPLAQVLHHYAPSHQRTPDRVPRTLFDTVRSFTYFKFCHGRRFFTTAKVIESVQHYAQQTRSWVTWMHSVGQIDAPHMDRLLSDVDAGVRDGTRRSLCPRSVPASVTRAVAVERSFRPFAILRPAHGARLRLCFVSRDLPPGPAGGIGVWVWCLARQMAHLGHDVTVVTETSAHPTIEFIDGCWVHRKPYLRQFERHNPDLSGQNEWVRDNNYRAFDMVSQAETPARFDVVLAPLWEAQGLACLRGRQGLNAVSLHTPLRTVIRTSNTWIPDEEYMHNYAKPMFLAEVELLTRSPIILGNSNAIVDEIEREYKIEIPRRALRIVPHGVEDLGTPTSKSASSLLKKVLFVGRFEARKGIDILLDTIPQLMAAHPSLIIELCGNNDIRFADGATYLSNFLARNKGAPWLDRVLVRGVVNDAELLEAYRSCDIFVAPSRFESFGLIFIEAMRFAKPVIALNIGGAREVLDQGVTGILLPDDSPSGLFAAIDGLLRDDLLRGAMGQRARAVFEQHFTATRMAERVAEVFLEARVTAGDLIN